MAVGMTTASHKYGLLSETVVAYEVRPSSSARARATRSIERTSTLGEDVPEPSARDPALFRPGAEVRHSRSLASPRSRGVAAVALGALSSLSSRPSRLLGASSSLSSSSSRGRARRRHARDRDARRAARRPLPRAAVVARLARAARRPHAARRPDRALRARRLHARLRRAAGRRLGRRRRRVGRGVGRVRRGDPRRVALARASVRNRSSPRRRPAAAVTTHSSRGSTDREIKPNPPAR